VLFALPIEVRRERRERREQTDRALVSVVTQLRYASETLGVATQDLVLELQPSGAVKMGFSVPYISTLPLEAALQAGDLALLEPELQGDLGRIQESVRIVKLLMDRLILHLATLDATDDDIQTARNLAMHLQSHCAMSISLQEDLLETLNNRPRRGFAGVAPSEKATVAEGA